MAKAEDYAKWIVANQDKQGTPDFETVAKAYQEAKAAEGLQAAPAGEGMPSTRVGAAQPADYEFSKTVESALPSLYRNTIGGLVDVVSSPLQTAQNIGDIVAGGVYKALPGPVQRGLTAIETSPYNPLGNPAALQRAQAMASAVGQDYARTYGTGAGFQKMIEEDPFRVVGDVSTVLGGGGAALRAANMGVLPNQLGRIYAKAGDVINPVNTMIKGTQLGGKLVTEGLPNILGLSTGVGGDTVKTAFESGLKGKTAFKENIRGDVPITQVLDDARSNLANMNAAKQRDYRSGMVDIKNDKTVLDFQGIDKALTNAENIAYYKGKIKDQTAANVLEDMKKKVADWKNSDPAEYHTPEGMDALKQSLYESFGKLGKEEKTAYSAGKQVYDSVKSEINAQAPTYAKVMKDYSESSDLIHEIERTLSLGQKASDDTALRKLQSLTRNNVITNYGQRTALAEQLAAQGGTELMPALAGQAMTSKLPRNLAAQGGAIGAGLAAFSNPYVVAAMPFMSPRLVGEAAYGTGALARGTRNFVAPVTNALAPTVANAQRLASQVPITAQQGRQATLAANQLANQQQSAFEEFLRANAAVDPRFQQALQAGR
jgi:hypothetical protein